MSLPLSKTSENNFEQAKIFFLLGLESLQKELFEDAEKYLFLSLNLLPNRLSTLTNLSAVLIKLNKLDKANEIISLAIELFPSDEIVYLNQGILFGKNKKFEMALISYEKAIELKFDYAEAYLNRGAVLNELRRLTDSLASYNKAIEFKKDYAEAYSNRGIVLQELERFDDALASHENAIKFRHDYPEAYLNRGLTLIEFSRHDKALESYNTAIKLNIDYHEAYFDKSLLLLSLQNFEIGWKLYESRWKSVLKDSYRDFKKPLWTGAESLKGKTILLHAEQGLGDTIQFCRYIPLVKKLGAYIILEVPKSLMSLLKDMEGVDKVVEAEKQLPSFDYQCPLLSLPLAFKTEMNSIPSPTTYLKSKDEKLDLWSQRLGEKSKSRVGLVWSGSKIHKNDHNRSLELAKLLNYLPNDYEYVSLQKEVRDSDKESLAISDIKHFGEQFDDFSDTAALCDLMDIVISVDTSVAHLSAALGKSVWILLPFVPDWRWLFDRDDSPWYLSVKLYRQGEDRQWEPVLERVLSDLKKINKSA